MFGEGGGGGGGKMLKDVTKVSTHHLGRVGGGWVCVCVGFIQDLGGGGCEIQTLVLTQRW